MLKGPKFSAIEKGHCRGEIDTAQRSGYRKLSANILSYKHFQKEN
jgi:hypothetical protein